MSEIRCIHRKTFEEHPSCFFKGAVKLPKEAKGLKIKKRKKEIIVDPWWADPRYKIGYFDIEATSLTADSGIVLSWVIKEKDVCYNDGRVRKGKIYKRVITKKEILDKNVRDKKVVEDFVNVLRNFKIIVGYYSKRYDMPFMRTRALMHGLDFPSYGEIYHFDLYDHVKRNLSLRRRTLEKATRILGIDGKNHVEENVWLDAAYGDQEALKYVLDHNVRDVLILEELHNKLYPFSKWSRTSI